MVVIDLQFSTNVCLYLENSTEVHSYCGTLIGSRILSLKNTGPMLLFQITHCNKSDPLLTIFDAKNNQFNLH